MNLLLAAGVESKWYLDIFSSTEVIAALLGAFAGGVMTYWATARLERRKQRKLELSLTVLLLMEVFGHLGSIEWALDKVLPHWLKRKRETYEKDYLLENTSVLKTTVYDQFFGELGGTDLGPYMLVYYQHIPEYNKRAREQPTTVTYYDLSFYVQNLSRLMQAGMDLTDQMRRLGGLQRLMKPFQDAVTSTDEHRQRRLLMTALCTVSQKDIEQFLANHPEARRLPEPIRTASPEELQKWIL